MARWFVIELALYGTVGCYRVSALRHGGLV